MPPSPAKSRGRPRRGRSASAEPIQNNTRDASDNVGQGLATVAEEASQDQQLSAGQAGVHALFVSQSGGPGTNMPTSLAGLADLASQSRVDTSYAADVVSSLVDLNARSTSLLHLLSPKTSTQATVDLLTKNLQLPASTETNILRARVRKLGETFVTFAGTDEYIWPEHVLRGVFGISASEDPEYGPWRPDNIMNKANLAVLANLIVPVIERSSEEVALALQRIDNSFPRPYLAAFAKKGTAAKSVPSGYSKLVERTFEIALAIRTQLAISLLYLQGNNAGFDPEATLRQVFHIEDDVQKPWSVEWAPISGLSLEQQVTARMGDIRGAIDSDDSAVDFAQLEAKFPWARFKDDLVRWIRARCDEIDAQVTFVGGADEMSANWEVEVTRWQQDPKPVDFKGIAPTARKELGSARKRTNRKRKSAAMADDDNNEAAPLPSGRVDPSVPVDPRLDAQRSEARAKVAKRTFYDPQPGAQRISWDDSQPTQIGAGTANMTRTAPDEAEQNATQDAGFQTGGAAAALQSPNVTGEQQGQMLGSAPEDSSQALPASSSYMEVKAMAKEMTAQNRRMSTPQKRKAWTMEETEALLDGISRHANAYAIMKKEDEQGSDIFRDRDAEGLRHKARNMKFDYLKTGVPLPEGFERVLLDRKFQEKLQRLGVSYTQDQARRIKSHRVSNAVEADNVEGGAE